MFRARRPTPVVDCGIVDRVSSTRSITLIAKGYMSRAAATLHLRCGKAGSVVDILVNEANMSLKIATELIRHGAVYCRPSSASSSRSASRLKRCLDSSTLCRENDYLRVYTEPKKLTIALDRINWKERVIQDNSDFAVLNKPAGLPCGPTADNFHECVQEQLKPHVSHAGILQALHRLDVDTQGLMILGKTKNFISQYNRYLREGRIVRGYRCVLCSVTPASSAKLVGKPLVSTEEKLQHKLLVSKTSPKTYVAPSAFAATDDADAASASASASASEDRWMDASSVCISASPHISHSVTEWRQLFPTIGSGQHCQTAQMLEGWLNNLLSRRNLPGHLTNANDDEDMLHVGFQHLEMQLVTGRTHQLRGQLSSLELQPPTVCTHIAGDSMYLGPNHVPVSFTGDVDVVDGGPRMRATAYKSSPHLALQSYRQSWAGELSDEVGSFQNYSLDDAAIPWERLWRYLNSFQEDDSAPLRPDVVDDIHFVQN